MTPLPPPLGDGAVHGWRLDLAGFARTWDSGEGAFRVGGRWNSKGVRAVYCALDPSTAILEVAVHKTFRVLDTVPHVLTALEVTDPTAVHVVQPGDVPNPHWLRPGVPGAGQQGFGDDLLSRHAFVVLPSAVSSHSWNLLFDPIRGRDAYRLVAQEPFALDTRLHPPAA
ncbi:RES domain-containing protein [Sphingomonas sp. 1185]|uniref:RES family NAD+ phosphorylase n=1 Tax=Sphingomonas sp. 1185 TaxID=3156411 RepID=UPI003392F3A0